MAEFSSNSVTVEAGASEAAALLADLENFPTWSSAIKQVEVHDRDSAGRPISATVKIEAGVLKDRAKLNYDYSNFPKEISFTLEEADLMTEMTGSYEISGDEDSAQVTYKLHVEVSMPVPEMMRKKAEMATIDAALSQLKKKLES